MISPPPYVNHQSGNSFSHQESETVAGHLPDLANCPIVVDLDGTLTPTDTLVESVVQVVKRQPWTLLQFPFWLIRGRAEFKSEIATRTKFSVKNLPLRGELLDYICSEKAKGRKIILATAAHRSIADQVAARLGLFDVVLASDSEINLKGAAKLKAIQETVGPHFSYAGDSSADLPIWENASAAILVGASARVAKTVRSNKPVEREFTFAPVNIRTWLRALRVHQWAKNLLLFVPLLTGFAFLQIDKLAAIVGAFIAFSLAASATYMVNDLWDLDNDRAHPRKRHRPFAGALITIKAGVGVAGVLLAIALAIAASISPGFLLMLGIYLVITCGYSWVLKEYVLVDVVVLSILYTVRIIAGSVAVEVSVSTWLLAFSVFLFLSLALVKRCAELVSLDQSGRKAASGRDYRVSDLTVLWPLGCGASLSAVVILGLFISAPETQERYQTVQLLWLVALGLVYWVARVWIKTSRGEMHDDPLVFALKDFGSGVTIALMLAATLGAHFLHLG
jgi:4-hydroxybenzoate polyprenyltransferase/phosphoserine phosphatase